MTRRVMRKLSLNKMPLLLAGGWMGIALLTVMKLPDHAQSPVAATPSFEVATIKAGNANASGGGIGISGDHFTTTNQTLRTVLKFAYNLNFGSDDQISGGPSWIGSARFDIDAKEEALVATELQKLPEGERLDRVRLMVQALLADRFQLKVHHETRDLTVYAITVAKNGSELKPAK